MRDSITRQAYRLIRARCRWPDAICQIKRLKSLCSSDSWIRNFTVDLFRDFGQRDPRTAGSRHDMYRWNSVRESIIARSFSDHDFFLKFFRNFETFLKFLRFFWNFETRLKFPWYSFKISRFFYNSWYSFEILGLFWSSWDSFGVPEIFLKFRDSFKISDILLKFRDWKFLIFFRKFEILLKFLRFFWRLTEQ